jgi:hypothetical protein
MNAEATVHDFDEQLAYSESNADQPWWEAVYRQAFPTFATMASVRKDGWAQRGGIDRVITLDSGRIITVDEKVRRRFYPDILLEVWSDHERRTPGWAVKDLACDFIAYAYAEAAVCYLLPTLLLRRAVKEHGAEWWRTYRRIRAVNARYTTVSVAVPTAVLLDAIRDAIVVTVARGGRSG